MLSKRTLIDFEVRKILHFGVYCSKNWWSVCWNQRNLIENEMLIDNSGVIDFSSKTSSAMQSASKWSVTSTCCVFTMDLIMVDFRKISKYLWTLFLFFSLSLFLFTIYRIDRIHGNCVQYLNISTSTWTISILYETRDTTFSEGYSI